MKKKLILFLLIWINLNALSWDMSISKIARNGDYEGGFEIDSLPDPWTLPEITWLELEGQKYTILEETENYYIVEYDGKYYILHK